MASLPLSGERNGDRQKSDIRPSLLCGRFEAKAPLQVEPFSSCLCSPGLHLFVNQMGIQARPVLQGCCKIHLAVNVGDSHHPGTSHLQSQPGPNMPDLLYFLLLPRKGSAVGTFLFTAAGACQEPGWRQGTSQPGSPPQLVDMSVPESGMEGWARWAPGGVGAAFPPPPAPQCLAPKGFLALPGGATSPEQKAEPLPMLPEHDSCQFKRCISTPLIYILIRLS